MEIDYDHAVHRYVANSGALLGGGGTSRGAGGEAVTEKGRDVTSRRTGDIRGRK